MTDAVAGRSAPIGLQQPAQAGREQQPAEQPEQRGDQADQAASSTTERSTWRRVAPSVRSSASSRVRCATVIENVL